jgi:hypothetical protein
MNDVTLAVDWNDAPLPKSEPALRWQILARVAFGLFMSSLVVLLALLYSDVLIV